MTPQRLHELREEAHLTLKKVNKTLKVSEPRRFVEMHNVLLRTRITYHRGCVSCLIKATSNLNAYFKKDPFKADGMTAKAAPATDLPYPAEGTPTKDWDKKETVAWAEDQEGFSEFLKENDLKFSTRVKEETLLERVQLFLDSKTEDGEETVEHTVTQEDIDNEADFLTVGAEVGDVIQRPVADSEKTE